MAPTFLVLETLLNESYQHTVLRGYRYHMHIYKTRRKALESIREVCVHLSLSLPMLKDLLTIRVFGDNAAHNLGYERVTTVTIVKKQAYRRRQSGGRVMKLVSISIYLLNKRTDRHEIHVELLHVGEEMFTRQIATHGRRNETAVADTALWSVACRKTVSCSP